MEPLGLDDPELDISGLLELMASEPLEFMLAGLPESMLEDSEGLAMLDSIAAELLDSVLDMALVCSTDEVLLGLLVVEPPELELVPQADRATSAAAPIAPSTAVCFLNITTPLW